MEVYITKYATTTGIIRIETTEEEWKSSTSDEKYFVKKRWFLRKNVDVFLSEEEAVEDFEAKKKKKLVSLKKQIAKLEKMQTKFVDE